MNAEERMSATALASHVVVMLSGNVGESRMKTSSGDRRPRI